MAMTGIYAIINTLEPRQTPRDGGNAPLVRTAAGRRFGPFEFRVLEEVPKDRLIDTERKYLKANVGGYRGGR